MPEIVCLPCEKRANWPASYKEHICKFEETQLFPIGNSCKQAKLFFQKINCVFSFCYPKWRVNPITTLRSFHKSATGIQFPSKSKTFTESRDLDTLGEKLWDSDSDIQH